ncbi:MAG TPA: hypothetical protein PKV72_02820 [Candidatus Peribacteria bacterium]|nr:hypothetical protein [Candidatus Peribacteria bacterium]
MKRIVLGLSFVSLAFLAACGGGPQLTAQQVLDKMHERFVTKITEQTNKVQTPLLAETVTNIALETQPIANVFPGSITAELKAKQAVDLTDTKQPKFDANVDFTMAATAPGEMFGIESQNPAKPSMEQATASVNASVRSLNAKLFLNIASLMVKQPGKSQVTLDKKLSSAWYMSTFKEINELLAQSTKDDPAAKPMTVESLIEKSVAQYRDSAKRLQELAQSAHVWNAVELLPDEDGMYRVRVEADKQKLAATLEAVMEYAMQQNDPTGMNAEMKAELERMKTEMRADVQKMGSLKGILYADKEFVPRGFVGQATDTGGTVQLDIDALMNSNGDAHFKLSNPKTPAENVDFQKKGDAYTFMSSGKKVAEGTMTPKKFTMNVFQDATTLATVDLDINKADDTTLDVKGRITIPAGGSEITIESFKIVFSNSFKNMKIDGIIHASLLGSPAIDLTIMSERKEVSAVKVEEPSVAKPMMTIQQDFAPVIQAITQ